jgi:hypothetical protein
MEAKAVVLHNSLNLKIKQAMNPNANADREQEVRWRENWKKAVLDSEKKVREW